MVGHRMAVVAQAARKIISARTKEALAAVKARPEARRGPRQGDSIYV